jgi:hypothetical protein
MEARPVLLAFNRGIVSPLAVARADMKRMAMSAEEQTNWMPRVLGAMSLRPGTRFLHSTKDDAAAAHLEFVFAADATALIELTDSAMRVVIDDEVLTRTSVASAVSNGGFAQYTDTATITIASPGVITYAGADSFALNAPVTLATTGALPTGLVAGTTYYVKTLNTGTNAITLSASVGGAAINTSGTQSGVHTLQAFYAISGWTDADEPGAVSSWASGGYLSLLGTGTNAAMRDQQVTVAGGDLNKEHALAIHIQRGEVTIRIGSSSGGEQYRDATVLRTGYHSLAFTPTGDFHIRLSSTGDAASLVDSVTVEAAGDMVVATPWPVAALPGIRGGDGSQSGDVIFVACKDYAPMRIERQATRSWSVVEYAPTDGPFRVTNTGPIRITASAVSGDVTLTASKGLFSASQVGALFRLVSTGQTVSSTLTAEDTFTNHIRVTGVGNARTFSVNISANPTFTATTTVTLQRSLTEPGDWFDVLSWTTAGVRNYSDLLPNQIAYYRLGIKTGDFTVADSVLSELIYAAGSIVGIARITGYSSPTSVSASVLSDLGSTSSTDDWSEGAWSAKRGYPSAVAMHDGRLWWAGKDKIWGSVSDAFDSFDDETEGDSGPISRSIGSGPVDTINWLLSLPSLLVGTQGAELVAKASSLDEPLTPTAFSLKPASTLGSAALRAVKVDTGGIYVQRSGSRVYELALDGSTYNYTSNDLTAVVPEIGAAGFLRVAVQRQPDTRIHCVRADGSVAILVFDRVEKVTCWVLYETDGLVEDVTVLPGPIEDLVYYTVRRTINGNTKRYVEKWALETEGQGDLMTLLSDSSIEYSGASTTTITGLDHLEGETVVVWGGGKDLGSYVVSSGGITLSEAVTLAYIGLPYTADFRSAKFTNVSEVPLSQQQQVHHVGLLLANTHAQGLRYGQDYDNLDGMPLIDDKGGEVDPDKIWVSYNADSLEVDGAWSNDARLCLRAASPRPCTVLATVLSVTGHVK